MTRIVTINAVKITGLAIYPTPGAGAGNATATYQVGNYTGGVFTPGLNQGSGSVTVSYTNANTMANILGAFNAGLQSQEGLNFSGGDTLLGE